MSEDNIKISVVTVCFNAQDTIKNTVESILCQDYLDLEYIIVDGESTDKTFTIVNELCNNKTNVKMVCEKDNGIYDAMNKAIDIATGDYVIFVNSGDSLINKYVLRDLADLIRIDRHDIYYGNIIKTIEGKPTKREKYDTVKFNEYCLLRGSMVCHQALVVSTKLMKSKKFNTKYKLAADKNFIVQCVKEKRIFSYIDIDICYYDSFGVSVKQQEMLHNETKDILLNNFPIGGRVKYLYNKIKRIC